MRTPYPSPLARHPVLNEQPGRMPPRLMTVGQLSRRTGLSVKVLREYADTGLVHTAGRSPGNYRLFDEGALSCVAWIGNLRSLGLTIAEIRELACVYCQHADQPIGPHLALRLAHARKRLDERISELEAMRQRIDAFEAGHRRQLAGKAQLDWWPDDPTLCARRGRVDSPPGVRP